MLLLNGYVSDFAFAARRGGAGTSSVACRFYLQPGRPYAHFGTLLRAIETLMLTGHPPAPLERTLITTGMLEALLNSRLRGGRTMPTPHLRLRYKSW